MHDAIELMSWACGAIWTVYGVLCLASPRRCDVSARAVRGWAACLVGLTAPMIAAVAAWWVLVVAAPAAVVIGAAAWRATGHAPAAVCRIAERSCWSDL